MASLLEEPINKLETVDQETVDQEKVDQIATTAGGGDLSVATAVADPARGKESLLPLLYISAAALFARLWFNFGTVHPNAYASADASEYIRYAQALFQIISGQSAGPISDSLKEFVITGPALPVFLLLASALSGHTFDPANSAIPLFAQSLISALTAGLIYLIAGRLYGGKTAMYAGIFAVIYPAFIVNSGRLYSETFATFVESLVILLIVRGFFKKQTVFLDNFFLGAGLIVLELTRSAMVLLTAASLPIIFLQGLLLPGSKQKDWRQASLRLALLLVGAAVVLTPWFVFEKAAYNKITLAVDRVGHYNLFVGTNTQTQGFLSYPYPDGRGIEEKSFFTLIRQAFNQSPSRFIKLAMDKPARLLKAPWNDFRTAIGPFDYKLQVALHQAILLLAVIGILVAGVVGPKENLDSSHLDSSSINGESEKRKIWGRATLLLAFALNLPYLAFITVPRYNLTAMPLLIIFAGAGLHTIICLIKDHPLAKSPKGLAVFALCLFVFLRDDLRDVFVFGQEPIANLVLVQGQDLVTKGIISLVFGLGLFASIYLSLNFLAGYKRLAKAMTVILALLTLPLLAIPQRANGRPGEGVFTLERPGECLMGTVQVDLPKAAPNIQLIKQRETWYLLIDSEEANLLSGKLDLTINGEKMTGPLIPAISALDDWTYLKQNGKGGAYLECAYIYNCMTQPAALTNLDLRQWFYLPLSAAFIDEARRRGCLNISLHHKVHEPTKLFTAALGKSTAVIPSRALYSWEKAFYGVENDSGLTDSRYDEKAPLRKTKWTMNYEKSSEELDRFDLNLRLLRLQSSSRASDSKKDGEITAVGTKDVSLPLSDALIKESPLTLVRATLNYAPDYKPENQYDIKVKEALPQLSIEWSDNNGNQISLPLPWLKRTRNRLDIAIPCDLKKIKGNHLVLKAHYIDPDCQIRLAARSLTVHPIFGGGDLY